MSDRVSALLKFLSRAAIRLGIAEHTYVVGGAVRNHLLNTPIKDLDLVIDSLGAGRDSAWFARQLQQSIPARSSLVTNQYGVAILTASTPWVVDAHDLKGETLEIANARRESYGGDCGKGYKPHLVEPSTIWADVQRRDFTVNTLLWRLADLEDGHLGAPVADLLGAGLRDLEARLLRTPQDPDRTFRDDPTRMLRAIKFSVRHGLHIAEEVAESIRKNALSLTQMPWDAVRKILVEDILQGPRPRESVPLIQGLGLNEPILRLLREEPGFHTGVSRGLAEADPLLLLDLWGLGWNLKGSPVGLVAREAIPRLRQILEDNPAGVARFLAALKSPPVDQPKLFERHNLQGAARQRVVTKARELLLLDPGLVEDPMKLEAQLSLALGP